MLAGAFAGLLTFVLEQTLARATLGSWVPVTAVHVACYLGAGAVLGLALRIALLPARAARLRHGAALAAFAFAALQAPALVERFANVLRGELGIAIGVLAVAGYALAIAALHLLARPAPLWLAPALGGCAAATALAINRNLFASFLEPGALAADAAVGMAAVLVAIGWRLRTRRAVAALALLLLAGKGPAYAERAPAAPPNLVLLVVDTLRHDVFRDVIDGTKEGRAFARAMKGSVWFTQAIAAAPWTVPSMGSIMTGRYPVEHDFERAADGVLHTLSQSTKTLAEALRERGYRTHALVTNDFLRAGTGMERGFDTYECLRGATWKLPLLSVLEWMGLLAPEPYQRAEQVRALLARRLPGWTKGDAPIFLWVHLMDPHEPLHVHDSLSTDPEGEGLPELDRRYRDEARYALVHCAGIVGMLEKAGVWENSIAVFTSDHGEMLPSDGHRSAVSNGGAPKVYGHGHALYDELLRVPLGIRLPGTHSTERRLDVLTSQVDLFATLVGPLSLPSDSSGSNRVSLAPWLVESGEPPASKGRRVAISGSMAEGPEQRALRTRREKVIEYPNGERPSEYYDIAADPSEQHDLAANRTQQLREALALLRRHWSELSAATDTGVRAPDAATNRRLKALGYVRE